MHADDRLEVGPRILARVCDEATGAFVSDAHQRHGVEIHTGDMIADVRPHDAGIDITAKAGARFAADLVVVGTGVKPNVELAASAGLAIDDGILVDEHCRTSDPAIFAAGDSVKFPGPAGLTRLENWCHAQDHGMVAGRDAAGASETYKTLPQTNQWILFNHPPAGGAAAGPAMKWFGYVATSLIGDAVAGVLACLIGEKNLRAVWWPGMIWLVPVVLFWLIVFVGD